MTRPDDDAACATSVGVAAVSVTGPDASAATFTPAEEAAMRVALAEARRGVRGANPVVGAALVDAAGTVLHTGQHRGAGTDHAEVDVLRRAREAGTPLTGTTLLVTLEPCHHTGRTGPCTGAILAAGVPRVVYAAPDPTQTARGGGEFLSGHGVDVRRGLLGPEARELNERWSLAARSGRPFVTLKIAQSLDGKVAAADGSSRWITGPAARAEGHALRGRVDAILVGGGTLRADDPSLTARAPDGTPLAHQPLRAVMSLRPVPEDALVRRGVPGPATSGGGDTATQVTRTARSERDIRDAADAAHDGDDGRFLHLPTHDPAAALELLREAGVSQVLVEGGPTVASAFLAADLVDELWLHQAPVLLGEGTASVGPLGTTTLSEAGRWRGDPVGVPEGAAVATVGEDCRWHLRPVAPPPGDQRSVSLNPVTSAPPSG